MDLQRMQQRASEAAQVLQACSHQGRLMLLCQLSQEELCVGALQARLGIQQPSLSQQLGILRRQGLIESRRDGQQVFYQVADERVRNLVDSFYQIFCDSNFSNTQQG